MFTIGVTASDMVTVQPTPPPTRQCSFTIGTLNAATYTAVGVALGQNVVINPSSISPLNWTGQSNVVVSLSHAYPGRTIQSSCTSTRPDIAIWVTPPTSVDTNTNGQVTFQVNAPTLGYADPNLGATPSVSCKFWFVPGFESTLSFPTANACFASNLSPMPAVCGNP
ncbi:hypothetical protein [Tahibacter soli]|uniref:Uncharacterized protein n=1 Tax=Tahibacter soli TaxID=2983605 RepID=A0A9X4BH78_9GAMM|nr:hypothetical protein [Tahibacter soli]MDC8012028.1 hypothetical protein [Tahibacter soli]